MRVEMAPEAAYRTVGSLAPGTCFSYRGKSALYMVIQGSSLSWLVSCPTRVWYVALLSGVIYETSDLNKEVIVYSDARVIPGEAR